MKAFLMYRDRDFDPKLLVARVERERRYSRQSTQESALQTMLPQNAAALVQDLGLDILFATMASGDPFLYGVARVAVLAGVSDPEAIRYRQRAFIDCIAHEAAVREMYQIAVDAIEGERKSYWSLSTRHPSSILHRSIDVLGILVDPLQRLRRLADRYADRFKSEAFATLFATLRRELSDDYFAEIDAHLKALKFPRGVLISAALDAGNKGTGYVLRRPHPDRRTWATRLLWRRRSGYYFQLHPRDESGARALSELRDQGINSTANALAQAADHVLSFFQMLRTEMAFYLGCLNLRRRLDEIGAPYCLPVPVFTGLTLSCVGLHDVCLALHVAKRIVGNDVEAEGRALFVITGANTGGKSTFLRSVGIAQLMMQAGMIVPADRFAADFRSGVFTHFKREEDLSMESGKLDEELRRMRDIVAVIRPGAMLLCNESLAATNEREGSRIADQVIRAMVDSGVKVLFVTHLFEFADNLQRTRADVLFLRAERRPDGTRSFRILPAPPLPTSFGRDLYEQLWNDTQPAPRVVASGGRP